MPFRPYIPPVSVLLMVLASCAAFHIAPTTPTLIHLAIYDDTGIGASFPTICALITKNPSIRLTRLKAADIRAGKLDGFDAVIFPGGSGSKQGNGLGPEGRAQVREFVRAGGGFAGFCAGSYLATCYYPWSLGILNARVVDSKHWARGTGDVRIDLSREGRAVLGRPQAHLTISYRQGPLLAPAGNKDLPEYRELARFATEVAKNGAPKGVMTGTTAIAAGEFGKGRVLCFSPHPELTPGLEDVLYEGLAWVAGK